MVSAASISPSPSPSTLDRLRREQAGNDRLLDLVHHGHYRPALRRRERLPVVCPATLVGHAAGRGDHAPGRRRRRSGSLRALKASLGGVSGGGGIASAARLDREVETLLRNTGGGKKGVRIAQLQNRREKREKKTRESV